jgi:hypothetical protein
VQQPDDFDIVQDEDEQRHSARRWFWPAIIALVALIAFGVGAAYTLASSRLAEPRPIVQTPVAQSVLTTTLTPQISPTVTLTLTGTRPLSVTLTPTLTTTPTLQSPCETAPDAAFAAQYDRAAFGCPQAPASIVWAAWQPFERGAMLWRRDNDASYILLGNQTWVPVPERWDGGAPVDRGSPPPGREAPVRGFGYVWSRNDAVFNGLGWAMSAEKGFCALVQPFELGFVLRSEAVPSCTPEGLYNQAMASDWTPIELALHEQGSWRSVDGLAPQTSSSEPPASDPAQGSTSIPAPNGMINAPRLSGISLDGRFDEWPGNWIAIGALVFGRDNVQGPSDLSANFQVGWLDDGLALAVRVNDERYRPGPEGTGMWQGDGLEIQFDRLLVQDFGATVADDDDYQLGVAFDAELRTLRGYLWLPFALEQPLALPGVVIPTAQGYVVELIIPWQVLGLTPGSVPAGSAYGFNISVNDNDAAEPAQQSVASASAARTTHDNPSEWATLRLSQ